MKSSPLCTAVPAEPHSSVLEALALEGQAAISLYFYLSAETFAPLPWLGPVRLRPEATLLQTLRAAQELLMPLAKQAPPPPAINPYGLPSRLRLGPRRSSLSGPRSMLMWITYTMHRWYPTEDMVLGYGHGGKGLPDLRLEDRHIQVLKLYAPMSGAPFPKRRPIGRRRLLPALLCDGLSEEIKQLACTDGDPFGIAGAQKCALGPAFVQVNAFDEL